MFNATHSYTLATLATLAAQVLHPQERASSTTTPTPASVFLRERERERERKGEGERESERVDGREGEKERVYVCGSMYMCV